MPLRQPSTIADNLPTYDIPTLQYLSTPRQHPSTVLIPRPNHRPHSQHYSIKNRSTIVATPIHPSVSTSTAIFIAIIYHHDSFHQHKLHHMPNYQPHLQQLLSHACLLRVLSLPWHPLQPPPPLRYHFPHHPKVSPTFPTLHCKDKHLPCPSQRHYQLICRLHYNTV